MCDFPSDQVVPGVPPVDGVGGLCLPINADGTGQTRTLSQWRMFKRQLRVSRLLDLDHECNSAVRAAKRERLACVLVRDGVHVLEVAIGASLDHASAKLRLLIWVAEVHN